MSEYLLRHAIQGLHIRLYLQLGGRHCVYFARNTRRHIRNNLFTASRKKSTLLCSLSNANSRPSRLQKELLCCTRTPIVLILISWLFFLICVFFYFVLILLSIFIRTHIRIMFHLTVERRFWVVFVWPPYTGTAQWHTATLVTSFSPLSYLVSLASHLYAFEASAEVLGVLLSLFSTLLSEIDVRTRPIWCKNVFLWGHLSWKGRASAVFQSIERNLFSG